MSRCDLVASDPGRMIYQESNVGSAQPLTELAFLSL
jgi:hypothetical protein